MALPPRDEFGRFTSEDAAPLPPPERDELGRFVPGPVEPVSFDVPEPSRDLPFDVDLDVSGIDKFERQEFWSELSSGEQDLPLDIANVLDAFADQGISGESAQYAGAWAMYVEGLDFEDALAFVEGRIEDDPDKYGEA